MTRHDTTTTEESSMTKTAATNVTSGELIEAQGGWSTMPGSEVVTVECPDDYDPALITAEDIIHDPAVTALPHTESI